MPELIYDPPVPARPSAAGFLQTIRLMDGSREIGHARWHVAGDGVDGVAQVLELSIANSQGRKGHGKRLLAALIAQCSAYLRARDSSLRRLWILVEQKRQVIGRSFLTSHGFSHVASLRKLLDDQDGLIYMRSFD